MIEHFCYGELSSVFVDLAKHIRFAFKSLDDFGIIVVGLWLSSSL